MNRLKIWLIAAMLALVLACSGGGGGGSPPGGNAGTAVPMTLAKLFGVQSVAVGARAVAIIGFPNAVPPHGFFPMAVPQSMVDNWAQWGYWFGDASLGHNVSFLGDSWWTTFSASSGNIQSAPGPNFGNPASLNLPAGFPVNQAGSSIYTQAWPQTPNPAPFQAAAPWVGQTVFLPIVNASGSGLTAITGVVPFKITGVNSNSIQGQFLVPTLFNNNPTAAIMAGSTPGGPFSYALTPPKLVQ
jgi:hypothetical protein